MKNINDFWKENSILSPLKDKEFLVNLWQEDTIPKTNSWYTQIFESIGKNGVSTLLNEVNKYNYLGYKDFLGEKRHLDIGSGTGLTSLYIHKNTPIPVEMIDVYDDDISKDVKTAIGKDFNFTLYKSGDLIPFKDQSFDSASLFYVLHHCENKDISLRLLKDIHRVLKKDSCLIVIEEPVQSISDRKKTDEIDVIINSYYASSGFKEEKGFDVGNFYTKNELEKQFTDAGFSMVKCIEDLEWSWLLKRSLYILQKN